MVKQLIERGVTSKNHGNCWIWDVMDEIVHVEARTVFIIFASSIYIMHTTLFYMTQKEKPNTIEQHDSPKQTKQCCSCVETILRCTPSLCFNTTSRSGAGMVVTLKNFTSLLRGESPNNSSMAVLFFSLPHVFVPNRNLTWPYNHLIIFTTSWMSARRS